MPRTSGSLFVLGFAAGCALSSAYGFLSGGARVNTASTVGLVGLRDPAA